jgi:hypothetical protein
VLLVVLASVVQRGPAGGSLHGRLV